MNKILENAKPLKSPDWSKEFVLYTDASDKAYGAVLLQENDKGEFEPVEFMSRTWKPSEVKWAPATKEFACLVTAVTKWQRFWSIRKPFYSEYGRQKLNLFDKQSG